VDVSTVEVEPTKSSVVEEVKLLILVSSVDITNGEDMEEYSVGLEKISFVVEKIFDEVAVDSALVVVEKVCV
jgi:hypothetical protein